MVSRSSSSHEVSSASVSGSMMRDEQSPEPEVDHPSNIAEAAHLQHHVPIGSVRIVRKFSTFGKISHRRNYAMRDDFVV
jgi:hypothetical protein